MPRKTNLSGVTHTQEGRESKQTGLDILNNTENQKVNPYREKEKKAAAKIEKKKEKKNKQTKQNRERHQRLKTKSFSLTRSLHALTRELLE